MLKLLIVEDNSIEREGLKTFIDWESFGFSEVYFASNGGEGYEKAIEINPDLIISDISMPIMNGLIMVEKIREKMPEIKVVFMTCFDEREYMLSAIRLNAYGYVLKPIIIEELTAAINKVLKITISEKNKLDKIISLEKEIKEYMPHIRGQIIRDLCYGNLNIDEELLSRLPKLDLDINKFYTVAVATLKSNGIEPRIENDYLMLCMMKNEIEELANKDERGIRVHCCVQNYKSIILVIYLDSDLSIDAAQDELLMFLNFCQEKIEKEFSTKIVLSFGNISSDLTKINSIFKMAEKSLESDVSFKAGSLIMANEIVEDFMFTNYNLQEIKDELSAVIDSASKDAVHDFANKYFSENSYSEDSSYKQFLFSVLSILQMILCERNERIENVLGNEMDLWEKILNPDNVLNVKQWFTDIILGTTEYLSRKEDNNYYEKIVKKIKEIIEEEYASINNIMNITERLYVSKNHANVIFKRYTGENIFDYLIQTRIEKAKILLNESTDKIYEIANKVGYKSNAYFTLVFKEYTGLTPKEYRLGVKTKKNE